MKKRERRQLSVDLKKKISIEKGKNVRLNLFEKMWPRKVKFEDKVRIRTCSSRLETNMTLLPACVGIPGKPILAPIAAAFWRPKPIPCIPCIPAMFMPPILPIPEGTWPVQKKLCTINTLRSFYPQSNQQLKENEYSSKGNNCDQKYLVPYSLEANLNTLHAGQKFQQTTFWNIFYIFLENRIFHFMQITSFGQFAWNEKSYFLGKIISICHLLNLPRVWVIKKRICSLPEQILYE